MPVLSPDRLLRAIDNGERGGVYFLFGDEEFLKEEAAARIIEAHLDPATRDFNLDQLRGTELDVEQLASVVQTPPMMAEWRVVVVREAQGLAASPRARAVVEELLQRTPPGLALVLLAQLPEKSKAKFYDVLKRGARSAEFARLSAADVPGWLMARAEAESIDLEPEAARALAAAVGPEMGALTRELAKLRDFVGERGRITRADVEAAVGSVPRQDRWEWFDLVGEAKFERARAALPVLFDSGESGVGLVIGLGTQFLRLALAAAGGKQALEAELPPHQRWLAGRLAAQARNWSTAALEAALDDLLRADRLLKSASLGDEQVMEELLLRLQSRREELCAA
ncbi:MAG TPA: DNA polymerase III subunit delta [Longimicrobiales bacterium]